MSLYNVAHFLQSAKFKQPLALQLKGTDEGAAIILINAHGHFGVEKSCVMKENSRYSRLCHGGQTPTLIRYKGFSRQGWRGPKLAADEFFGEGCLAGQVQRISTVSAMTDSVIMQLEKTAIVRVIHQEPAFSEMFIAHLLGRTIRIEADLVDQLFNSSEKRLARLLLLLANFGKDEKPDPILATISQETLADMIGTTRSRVSFFMNKFRKLGLIDYNGGIEVHSSLLNVVLHDEPHITP